MSKIPPGFKQYTPDFNDVLYNKLMDTIVPLAAEDYPEGTSNATWTRIRSLIDSTWESVKAQKSKSSTESAPIPTDLDGIPVYPEPPTLGRPEDLVRSTMPVNPACPTKPTSPWNTWDPNDPSTPVHHPPHYTAGTLGIETIDAIRNALTPNEFRGYCKGNVLKYVSRERLKGGDADLAKALEYLKFLIEPTR